MGSMADIKCTKCEYKLKSFAGCGAEVNADLFVCPKCQELENCYFKKTDLNPTKFCSKCGTKFIWVKFDFKFERKQDIFSFLKKEPDDPKEDVVPSVNLCCPECKSKELIYSFGGLWD